MAGGFLNKILWVDLNEGFIKEEMPGEAIYQKYFGGYGLGVKILYDNQRAGVDPLGPDNILGFVPGLLTGPYVLGGSRFSVVTKSPLTGTWGDSSSGGNFGPHLKFAGYDAIFFTGIASKPVYLLVSDGKVEICDAEHLWGKDTHETEDCLTDEFGKGIEVACIGPAGENVSLISAIITAKGRAAGRSGVGAVMGSKKLKAVVVKGNAKIPVYDETKIKTLRNDYRKKLTGLYEEFSNFGTPAVTELFATLGDAPVKNWSGICEKDFPQIHNIGLDAVMERQEKKYGCYRCVVACGGLMKESQEEYQYEKGVHKTEYETLSMFGTNCLNGHVESIIKANDMCNRYGLDTISAGATISFAIDCYENGVITKKDTDGLEMTWGNHDSIIKMLNKLAVRDGFGDILSDGTKIAAEKIGGAAGSYAVHYHGQEPPAHHPKFDYGFASCYRMDATPARHTRWHPSFIPHGVPIPEYEPGSWDGRGENQKINMMLNHALEGFGLCLFVVATYPHVNALIEFLEATTGWGLDLNEVLKGGERIAVHRHLFNLREGFNPLAYPISGRLTGNPPMTEGPLAGVTVDEEKIANEFLEAMDWDLTTTVPSRNKFRELDLEYIAGEFYPEGNSAV